MSDDVAVGASARDLWWLPLVQGILAIVLGLLFFSNPAATSVTMAFFIGIWWFVRGIMDIVLMFVDHTMWGWKLFMGILGILAGWLVMSYVTKAPILTTLGLGTIWIWVLGIMGIMMGFVDIYQAFKGAGWGRGLLGVLMILLGIWLVAEPVRAALTLPWVFGVLLVFGGIMAIVAAFQLKKA